VRIKQNITNNVLGLDGGKEERGKCFEKDEEERRN
jgi:hypothetical protein